MDQQLTNLPKPPESLGKVLAEQPDKSATLEYISALLIRLSELYALKDFTGKQAGLLAFWVMENYKYDTLNIVLETLKNPPDTEQKTWRLTPDTIREWMAITLDKQAQKREVYINNKKFEEMDLAELDSENEKRLAEWLETIDKAEGPLTKSSRMSEKEVRQEGQERPQQPKYTPPGIEYVISRQLHLEWIRECFDPHTAKPNANWISEDEWIKLQK